MDSIIRTWNVAKVVGAQVLAACKSQGANGLLNIMPDTDFCFCKIFSVLLMFSSFLEQFNLLSTFG